MRDKLVELLRAGQKKFFLLDFEAKALADYLIANGVTVGDVTDNNVVNTPANERLPVKLTRVDFAKCEGCHWQYAPDGQTDCWVCKDNDHYVEGK